MTGWKSVSRTIRVRRRLLASWLLAVLLAVTISILSGQVARSSLFDSWQRLSSRDLSATDVRVVMIDSQSLKTVGPWPWPRYYLARLTEEIARGGARVIGFDMIFAEPDRVRPDLFLQLYPELGPEAAREVSSLPPMDRLFGQVIGMAPVVLARAGSMSEAASAGLPPVDQPITGTTPPGIDSWPGVIASIPEIDGAALGHGLINGQPDPDGIIRSIGLVGRAGGQLMPGLALEMSRIQLGAGPLAVSPDSVTVGSRTVPVDGRGRMILKFGTFPDDAIISAETVLGRKVAPGYFRDKAVLVGLGATGTADIVATPLAAENFGLLVQAQAIDAIPSKAWLSRPLWVPLAEWIVAILLAGLALMAALRAAAAKLGLVAALAAVPLASWILFTSGSIMFDPIRPTLVGAGALAGIAMGLFAEARRDRRQLREALVEERVAAAASEGELRAAREIQLGMVPPRPQLAAIDPRLDADALLEPARSVGGDLYECIRTGPDTVGFAVGDVTGKGVPAALFMAMSKALLTSALCRESGALARAVSAINRDLMRGNEEAMSVTMIIGHLDLSTGTVSLVSAGHEDPYIMSSDGTVRRCRLEGGPPLAMVEFDYPVEPLSLGDDDTLILVTDGITEAQDPGGALYGRDRIAGALAGSRRSATALCEALRDDVRRFEAAADPTDDLTVMAVRRIGPVASEPALPPGG